MAGADPVGPRPTPVKVTPADIRRALETWRRDAPEEYRGLLDAKPEPEGKLRS